MDDRFVFPIHYDERVLQGTVRSNLLRTFFGGRPVVAATIIVVLIFYAIYIAVFAGGSLSFADGLLYGFCGAVFLLVSAAIALRQRSLRARLKRMSQRQAVVRLNDERIQIEADSVTVSYPWSAIKEVRRMPYAWLLMLDLSEFATLPLRGVPPEALDFINSRIAPSRP